MIPEEQKRIFSEGIARLTGTVPDDLFISLFCLPLRKRSTGQSWPDGGGAGTERGDITDTMLWCKLTSFRHEFARGNKAAAFDIFSFCNRHDLTLPDDVSQWINEHPDRLVRSRKSRDKSLRDRNWRFELLTLVALFSITPDEAAGVSSVGAHDAGGKLRPDWPDDSAITARFSPCGRYRYELSEVWDCNKPLVLWILMNPSVACLDYSDPTLRRTGNFSRSWGYGGQLVGNVHAYRATNKNDLLRVDDPVGPDNDQVILAMANRAQTVVLAYGSPPRQLKTRGQEVTRLLQDHPGLSYLKLAKDGVTPVHPLYLSAHLQPILF